MAAVHEAQQPRAVPIPGGRRGSEELQPRAVPIPGGRRGSEELPRGARASSYREGHPGSPESPGRRGGFDGARSWGAGGFAGGLFGSAGKADEESFWGVPSSPKGGMRSPRSGLSPQENGFSPPRGGGAHASAFSPGTSPMEEINLSRIVAEQRRRSKKKGRFGSGPHYGAGSDDDSAGESEGDGLQTVLEAEDEVVEPEEDEDQGIHLSLLRPRAGMHLPIKMLSSSEISSVTLRVSDVDFRNYRQDGEAPLVYGKSLGSDKEEISRSIRDRRSTGPFTGMNGPEALHVVLDMKDCKDITVRTVRGTEHTYNIPRSSSIDHLKQLIYEEEGVSPTSQELSYMGSHLKDNETPLGDHPLVDDDQPVLHLEVKRQGMAKIRVRSLGGGDYELTMNLDEESLSTLKERIESLTEGKARAAEQRLVHNGRFLDRDSGEENAVLSSLGLKQNSTILMAPKPVLSWDDVGPWVPIAVPIPGTVLPKGFKDVLWDVNEGLMAGRYPQLAGNGTGGAYLMWSQTSLSCQGAPADWKDERIVAVFKPQDEEAGAAHNPHLENRGTDHPLKEGVRVGEGALRECIAYILDHGGLAGVPPTALVWCRTEEGAPVQVGSMQKYVPHSSDCDETGSSLFAPRDVHAIAILDIRLFNTDRHGGNILCTAVKRDHEGPSRTSSGSSDESDELTPSMGNVDDSFPRTDSSSSLVAYGGRSSRAQYKLTPIDHGYSLPDCFSDASFDWLYWPQAEEPLEPDLVAYVEQLDARTDLAVLAGHGILLKSECQRTLRCSTELLKRGVAAGLSLARIGAMCVREDLNGPCAMETMAREVDERCGHDYSDDPDEWMATFEGVLTRHLEHHHGDDSSNLFFGFD